MPSDSRVVEDRGVHGRHALHDRDLLLLDDLDGRGGVEAGEEGQAAPAATVAALSPQVRPKTWNSGRQPMTRRPVVIFSRVAR